MHRSAPLSSIGATALLALMLVASAPAQPESHYPASTEEVFVRFTFKISDIVKILDVPVKLLSPLIPGEPEQVVKLPGGFPEVHLKYFVPRGQLEQTVVPDPSGESPPVITLTLRGPKLTYERRLMANDPARSRLVSLIGSWQYLWEPDPNKRQALYRQFETDLTRAPAVVIARSDGSGSVRVPVTEGTVRELDELGCVVRVKSFYPHFSSDPKTGKPFNLSVKRQNPAVQLELEQGGEKRVVWAFSRYPEFSRDPSGGSSLRVRLDCPLEMPRTTPDLVLVGTTDTTTELWLRHAGKTTARPLAKDEDVKVPGSQYTFRITGITPSGRLTENYSLTKADRAETVLQIETREPAGGGETLWLVLNRERTIDAGKGALHVALRSRDKRAPVRRPPRGSKQ